MGGWSDFWLGKRPPQIQGITPEMQEIIDRYERQHQAANKANLFRYRQMTGIARQNIGTARQNLQMARDTTGQNRKDIRTAGREMKAEGAQGMAARGLYNTTVLDSNNRAVGNDTQAALNRERDYSRGQIMDARNELAGSRNALASTIYSRNDPGPDAGFYSQLLYGLGAANQANQHRPRSGGILHAAFG